MLSALTKQRVRLLFAISLFLGFFLGVILPLRAQFSGPLVDDTSYLPGDVRSLVTTRQPSSSLIANYNTAITHARVSPGIISVPVPKQLCRSKRELCTFSGEWIEASPSEWERELRIRGCEVGGPKSDSAVCCASSTSKNSTVLRRVRFVSSSPFNLRRLTALLGNYGAAGTMTFFGDSVSNQAYDSLLMRARAEGYKVNMLVNTGTSRIRRFCH